MSFRRSTRKRHFPLSLSKRKNDEIDFDYDGTKKIIYALEDDLKQIRKKLKPIKQDGGKKVIPEIGPIKEIMREKVHPNIRSLNNMFFMDYEEELNLRQQLEETQHQLTRTSDDSEKKDEDLRYLQVQLSKAENNRKKLELECSELKTRLGSVESNHVKTNEPGSADLVDHDNRLTEIAEKLAEIYECSWADSMNDLKDLGFEEEKCVEILLHILTDSYEECGRKVREMNMYLKKAMMITDLEYEDETNRTGETNLNLAVEVTKPVLDFRQRHTDEIVNTLQKTLPDRLQKDRDLTDDQISACRGFIEDCIKYAWMMQIQDPPVFMEWTFPRESDIDSNLLECTSEAGDQVDYIVWPVVYHYKGGPVLNKGIVQPIQHT